LKVLNDRYPIPTIAMVDDQGVLIDDIWRLGAELGKEMLLETVSVIAS